MIQTLDDSQGAGDLILQHALAFPDKTAVVLVRDGMDDGRVAVSYGELAARAARRARWLTAAANGLDPGDRVMLALPTGMDFVETYVACLIAGLVAVPVPIPESSRDAGQRFAGIARDARVSVVLAMEQDLGELRDALDPVGRARVLPVTPLPDDGMELPATAVAAAGDLAVLQYTSGSIGDPKGVMISNANVVRNARALSDVLRLGPADRIGGWAPLYHDMGLFLLLSTSLVLGITCFLMSPIAFLKRPKDWLRMVQRHRITVTAAPNFAYDMCLRNVSDADLDALDLSSLRYVLNGAEPIVERVMRGFTERFAPAGLDPLTMSPGYGLAESTVYSTVKPPGTVPRVFNADTELLQRGLLKSGDANTIPLVGCGFANDLDLRIVDPDHLHDVPPGVVGEIWVRGPSVGLGYWRNPEATDEIFRATTGDGDEWLRTGDLGAFVDGELFVTGRRKELLIIRGRNLYPQDIEVEARASHSALTGLFGAAFSVPGPAHESPVIVHEVRAGTAEPDLTAIVASVQERLSARLGLAVDNIVLVRRGTVRRTTSGKIQRLEMRSRFLRGELAWRHAVLNPDTRRLVAAEGERSLAETLR